MKRILSIFLLFSMLALSYTSKSQGAAFSQTATNTTGTITNAGIDTMTYHLTKGYSLLLVDAVIVRASGTTAGTAILEWSVRGTVYKSDVGDTLTVANAASQTLYWSVKVNPARYWRIRIGGATTVSATATARLQTD